MDVSNGNSPSETMNTSEDSKTLKPQQKSVKSYASGVFQKSTIGMVASIVSTDSRVHKSFKTILLLLSILGFFYQCTTHLLHVFEYPTVVGLDIDRNGTYDMPSFTFCNNNGMNRTVFCSKYPDRCFKANEKFCLKYPNYCHGNKTFVPKKQYYEVEKTMTFDEILKYGDNLEEYFISYIDEYYMSGPFIKFKDYQSNAMVCYSLYSVVDNTRKPDIEWNRIPKKGRTVDEIPGYPNEQFKFYVDEKKMFVPGNEPGIFLSINSPYLNANPFGKGLFLKPGGGYKIFISMEQEKLLEPPYQTNCRDYIKQWEANKRTGPRTQLICKLKCHIDFDMLCYNCSNFIFTYPSEGRRCTKDDYKKTASCDHDKESHVAWECWKSCKEDCSQTKYTFTVLEMDKVNYGDDTAEEDERYITVLIYYEVGEIITKKHAPKYTTVEVFSAIGGFSGVWLGISFMDIIDAIGNAFLVFRYAVKKRKKPQ